jgi:hypothetical protein
VLSGVDGSAHDRRLHIRRCGDDDGVDIAAAEHFAPVVAERAARTCRREQGCALLCELGNRVEPSDLTLDAALDTGRYIFGPVPGKSGVCGDD